MRDDVNIKALWGDQYDITHTPKKKGDRSSDLIASKLQSDRLPPTHCKPGRMPPEQDVRVKFQNGRNT